MQGRLFRRFREVKATVLGRRHDTTFTWNPTNYMAQLYRRKPLSQPSALAYPSGAYRGTVPLGGRLVHGNGLGTHLEFLLSSSEVERLLTAIAGNIRKSRFLV